MSTFSALERIFGKAAVAQLADCHFVVIGVGGVGSWAAEALARSGVGALTLIDLDDISISNVNRQVMALNSTLGELKIVALKQRLMDINPRLLVNLVEDFITPDNVRELLFPAANEPTLQPIHGIIDAVDDIQAKASLIYHAKRNKVPIIVTGGAGGQFDPTCITYGDLAKTKQDPLLAKLRNLLRRQYGFSTNPARRFGVEAIYSTEQIKYPTADGNISTMKSQAGGASRLDCSTGFGSFVGVTASFGMVAASRLLHRILQLPIPKRH